MKQASIIAPSLLSANFAHLAKEVRSVLDAGAQWLHVDVMDNHFVPNLTMGPLICEALKEEGIQAPLDVHLMLTHPENMIQAFAKAGASYITIHAEVSPHLDRYLQQIRELGCKAGLAFNPSTPIHCLDYVLDKCDLILLMSVNPGFGGQTFIPSVLKKIKEVRERIDNASYAIRLSVDGGINAQTIKEAYHAGADTFVAGQAIFKAKNRYDAIQELIQYTQ